MTAVFHAAAAPQSCSRDPKINLYFPPPDLLALLWCFGLSDCPPLPPSLCPYGLVPSVGLGYGLRYIDPASPLSSEPLVFEAASRPGTGRLIFTAGGLGNAELSRQARCAMEWAMVSPPDCHADAYPGQIVHLLTLEACMCAHVRTVAAGEP